ncbi:zinc-ribbon domain-containing protein [Streptomyces qinzhouensis]|uniref:Zinc-ribbon domain-containing protein n=1 Tax=Streptomyces qinzhouensis TaxID=2599401 RepID=A0A5B8IKJ3_9ACTN|nr:zinc-ribbon domain-containing protein [Streptomyces qinzhouensis]
MIIFGTKGYLYQLAIVTLVCGRCGNPAAHTLRKRVTKFTLFFVPLFPVSTKYGTQCTFCGAESQLSGDQAEQLQAQAATAPAPGHGPQQANPFAQGNPFPQGGPGQGGPGQGGPGQGGPGQPGASGNPYQR